MICSHHDELFLFIAKYLGDHSNNGIGVAGEEDQDRSNSSVPTKEKGGGGSLASQVRSSRGEEGDEVCS